MLIGLVGFANSGKNSIGSILINDYQFQGDSFAKSLKDAASAIFGWDRVKLEGDTQESRFWREQTDGFWSKKLGIKNFTPRMGLQWLGTDACRKVFGEDIWVSTVERRWIQADKPATIITDCRFPNEIKMIRDNGGKVFLVERGETPPWYQLVLWVNKGMGDEFDQQELNQMRSTGAIPHESETAWIGCKLDGEIKNNGKKEDLKPFLTDFLKKELNLNPSVQMDLKL